MSGRKQYDVEEFNHKEMVKTGYEVYADGPTRVLRFCEISSSNKRDTLFQSWKKIQLRVPQFTVNLLEHGKQVNVSLFHTKFAPLTTSSCIKYGYLHEC